MSEINCGIIADLLPLYAENMLGEDSRKTVEEHLASCEECRKKYEQMTAAVPMAEQEIRQEAEPLKKFRFHMLLNVLGFPLWLPLLIVAASVLFSVYISVWVTVICLWCVPLSCGAASLAGIIGCVVAFARGYAGNAFFSLGMFFVGAGIAILSYFGCLWLTKWVTVLTAHFWNYVSSKFRRGSKTND